MQFRNIYQMLVHRADKESSKPAYFSKDGESWKSISWHMLKEEADLFAKALLKSGLEKGDTVSILAGNCLVWPLADLGTIAAGGVGVGLYPSSSPEQCAYILNHSRSKFVVVDSAKQLEKILKIKEQVASLQEVIYYSDDVVEGAITWKEFLEHAKDISSQQLEQSAQEQNLDDTAIIVYTSGTTGHPKGACLSHRYVIASCQALDKVFTSVRQEVPSEVLPNPEESWVSLSFLPYCHVAERISGMYSRLYSGTAAYLVDDISRLFEYMRTLNPHVFGGLPRFYEKLAASIMADVEKGVYNKEEFDKAIAINKEYRVKLRSGENISPELEKDFRWAEENIAKKVRSCFGSRIVFCSSGAAPIPGEVLDLFAYAGNLDILEAYGLTEFVCCAFSTPNARRVNSVGKPMLGCEVKIAEDGEILLGGPQMFSGYLHDEKATNESIQDGHLHTGDIGKLDEDGFLYITGRKKEFIKTSTGKKIAPLYIENLCKRHHLISNVMVYGDNKKYLTALITISLPDLIQYAKVHKLSYSDPTQLIQSEKIQDLVQQAITEVNEQVSRTEQIKKYTILPRDFSIEENEITPTGKVKRKKVAEIYQDVIEGMYGA